ncbi:hypothetical protein NSS79_25805 [Paenibacillus sp. FSL L8-0436]|uniref:hypothetical protein n=1 Tax=Paenibacillus sp. FSL L8-0436 TaxID=2954686 RepID=UPI003158AC72
MQENKKDRFRVHSGAVFVFQGGSVVQEVGFKEAGELLDTPVSTLRRWVVLLEEQGYAINRDGKRRQLDWLDVGMLREVKFGLQQCSLEEAVRKAVQEVKGTASSVTDQAASDPAPIEVFDQEIKALLPHLFWYGPDQAVNTLVAAWENFKCTSRRE